MHSISEGRGTYDNFTHLHHDSNHCLSACNDLCRLPLFQKNNDTSDFYLGGRNLGPLVTAMSAEASDMSSWLLMGLPGLAYLSGIADAGWTAIGLAIGTYLNWKIVAKRIRSLHTCSRQFDYIAIHSSATVSETTDICYSRSELIFIRYFLYYVYGFRIRSLWKNFSPAFLE